LAGLATTYSSKS